MVQLLIEEGYVDGKDYFLDGTKIEANANKYTFVWRKRTEGEKGLQAKIEANLQVVEDAIAFDIDSLKRQDDTFSRERISREALEEITQHWRTMPSKPPTRSMKNGRRNKLSNRCASFIKS
jgi:hypothetical protein